MDTLTCSPEHPFFVVGEGWVAAGALGLGSSILTRAGPCLTVCSLEWQRAAGGYTVYNFTVSGNHSYLVGVANGGVWVHNVCWSRGKSGNPLKNLFGHWTKHRAEFPKLNNAIEYYNAATDFFRNLPEDAVFGYRSNGDTVMYQPSTEHFGIANRNGVPSTLFRPNPAKHGLPTNWDYFLQELSR